MHTFTTSWLPHYLPISVRSIFRLQIPIPRKRKGETQMSVNRRVACCSVMIAMTVPFLSSGAIAQEKRPTAREVITQIQQRVGVPWQAETVDTFKAGNPDSPVTGVAVTMMATMDVLERASASGKNLIITHEPTFYNHLDKLDELEEKENDPVLAEKLAFIAKQNLVIWRFHDHWHMRIPDGIEAGMAHALGWEKYQVRDNPYLFEIPEPLWKPWPVISRRNSGFTYCESSATRS